MLRKLSVLALGGSIAAPGDPGGCQRDLATRCNGTTVITEAKESSAVSSPEPADEFSEVWGEREEARGGCWAVAEVMALAPAVSGAIESHLWLLVRLSF